MEELILKASVTRRDYSLNSLITSEFQAAYKAKWSTTSRFIDHRGDFEVEASCAFLENYSCVTLQTMNPVVSTVSLVKHCNNQQTRQSGFLVFLSVFLKRAPLILLIFFKHNTFNFPLIFLSILLKSKINIWNKKGNYYFCTIICF